MAKFMGQVRGGKVAFDPDRVVMSGGATGAQDTLAFCLADPGDAYLVPTPYYPAYVLITPCSPELNLIATSHVLVKHRLENLSNVEKGNKLITRLFRLSTGKILASLFSFSCSGNVSKLTSSGTSKVAFPP